MVNAAKGSKVKQRPIKKVKKAAAKKHQLKKPVEEEEVPLPATRKSDDPIPKKVIVLQLLTSFPRNSRNFYL